MDQLWIGEFIMNQFERLSKVLAKSFEIDEQSLLSRFRLAEPEEIARVSALRRQVFGNEEIKENDELYLKWRYFDREGYAKTLWVFEYEYKIIAALGTEPVDLWHDGRIIKALRNMDVIVDPSYNNRGIGAWMTLAMQKTNDCILVTGGNENSASMLAKLFTRLSVKKHYKIILHSRYFLSNKLSKDSTARLISPFFDLFSNLRLLYKWVFIKESPDWRVEQFNSISQILPFIPNDRLVGSFGRVKVLRTAEYLKWRYAPSERNQIRAFALFEQTDLLGYVISLTENVTTGDSLSRAFIMDWDVFSKSENEKILTSLLKASLKELKQAGMDEINMMLSDAASASAATRAGFIYRYEDPNFFVFHKKADKAAPIFSADAWYHSLGDADTV